MLARQLVDDAENRDSAALAEAVADLDVSDANPHHYPAGTRKGGQFAPKGNAASGGTAKDDIPSHEDQVKSHQDLKEYFTMLDSMRRKGGMPEGMDSVESFLLKHGQPYFVNEKTYAGKRDTPKMCYMNATMAILDHPDRTYVEGYITTHGIPIAHAWTVDNAGQVYDSTIVPKGGRVAGYYGIPFANDYVFKSNLANKHYGLLGFSSRKTLVPLLEGKVEGFKKKVGDANPYHEPAGSPKGGQFASKAGGYQAPNNSATWKNAEDVERGFFENHGIYITPGDDSFVGTTFIGEQAYVDRAKVIDQKLIDMKQKFPGMIDRVNWDTGGIVVYTKNVGLRAKGQSLGSAGIFNHFSNILELAGNTKRYGAENHDPLVDNQWHVSGGFLANTFAHEYGHALQYGSFGADAVNVPRDMPQSKLSFWENAANDPSFKAPSRYARTNGSEMFAESVAAYTHPKYKRGFLDAGVEKYFDIIFKSETK